MGNNLVGSTSGTVLAQELIESIIDEVAENSFDDLKACALAARCFRPRTLYHLFRCLSFTASARCSQFLDFISESPHIPPHYTVLKFVSHSRTIKSMDFRILKRVFASLINVQVLWLYGHWGRVIGKLGLHTYIAMPLKEVHLNSALFSSLQDFAVIFKAFRGVQVVGLEKPRLVMPSEALAFDRSELVSEDAPAVLRELVLNDVPPAIVDVIASMDFLGSLKAVERFEYRGPNSPALTTFLDCRALKSLVLQVSVNDDSGKSACMSI